MILGPHGAGLTNMIFMPTGSSVIKFPMLPEIERCFEYMAAALGLVYGEVPGLVSHHAGHYVLDKTTLASAVHVVGEAVLTQRTFMENKRAQARPAAIMPLPNNNRWPPSPPPPNRTARKAKPAGTPPPDVSDELDRPGPGPDPNAANDGGAATAVRGQHEGGGGTDIAAEDTVATGQRDVPRTAIGGGSGGEGGLREPPPPADGAHGERAAALIRELQAELSKERADHAESARAKDAALEKVKSLTDQNLQLLRRQQRPHMLEL